MSEHYVVISADCHGGGNILDYKPYLEKRYHDEFDEWAATYEIPYEDMKGPAGSRNWDSDRRLREMEEDGIVAEVIYPNTVPPFYPKPSLSEQPPAQDAGDMQRRWAGLQAHNRWMADFCQATPGRRAGIAQIMLHDLDAAIAELGWAKENGLTGGVLLPGTPPGSSVPPLYDIEYYDRLWAACADLELPVNHHSGSAAPPMGEGDIDKVQFILEVTWWAHRALYQLIFSGALERHPSMQLVFTESGTAWIPPELMRLDYFYERFRNAVGSQEHEWGFPVASQMSLKPSEYWARQCHVAASFQRPAEVPLRHVVGVDRVMWGSDYPHKEASYPFSREAIRLSYSDVDPAELRAILGGNAAALYGFDLAALQPVADKFCPTVGEVARPITLAEIPAEADRCPALVGASGPSR